MTSKGSIDLRGTEYRTDGTTAGSDDLNLQVEGVSGQLNTADFSNLASDNDEGEYLDTPD